MAVGNSLKSISTSRRGLKLPAVVQIGCDPLNIGKRYTVEAAMAVR